MRRSFTMAQRRKAGHALRLGGLGIAAAMVLASCAAQPIASFTRPDVTVDAAQAQHDLYFQPGSAHLAPGEAARLNGFLKALLLRPEDDVVVFLASTESNALNRGRIATAQKAVSVTPARLRIVAPTGFARAPAPRADAAFVQVLRYDRIVVDCRNSGRSAFELETLQPFPAIGCTNAINLAQMTASPRDLAAPRALRGSDPITSVAAVQRYRAGEVIVDPLQDTTTGN